MLTKYVLLSIIVPVLVTAGVVSYGTVNTDSKTQGSVTPITMQDSSSYSKSAEISTQTPSVGDSTLPTSDVIPKPIRDISNTNIVKTTGSDQNTIPVRATHSDESGVTVFKSIFEADTNKILYHGGDTIQVFGRGDPNSPIKITLSGPSEKTFTVRMDTENNGSFNVYFPTPTDAEKGRWYITTTHIGKSIVSPVIMD